MNIMIKDSHSKALSELLERRGLSHVLFLNPSLGNVDMWLKGQEELPTPAPFDRNSAYIFAVDGELTELCQTTTHPTDRAQFPHFEDMDLSHVFRGKVGVVNPMFLKKNLRDHLESAYGDYSFVDVTEDFYALKAVKTPEEIEALGKAAQEYDRLFTAMPLVLRAERLEKEVVNELRQRAAWQGAESETPGFHTMVELTSAPEGQEAVKGEIMWPGRRLRIGDRVNISVRGYQDVGYAAALGRSFVLGQSAEETQKLWSIAREAQTLAADLAKPGTTLRQVAGAVDAFLEGKGLPAPKSAWIYGVGTSAYEQPRNVDASADWPLQENMVLAIGPEILPQGQDPYRCLDVFVVTGDGAVRLNRAPQTLREI